ncbi:N-acetylmuramoyl-L-alanine amidase family protein [Cytobacillus praedii]|uniref:peptidoglycan recognition protein family protein n=1 Tax=Cytobacillus praedii TaxID=1742358 RepID=UPI002EB2754A|nr:N-acetylmuramoyl-L-alanine amidase family protein [Cytobacillus praedii]
MTIPVRKMLVQSKNHKIKCPNNMAAEYITVHNTYNDASANNEVQYMINNTNQVSFHFAVDDKEVVQGIPVDRIAWHCGDGKGSGNQKSIGVEICYSKSGGTKYYQAEGLTIQFIAQLLKERGWGIDRVKKHQDWSGKYCPHRILDEGRWQSFLDAIKAELNKKDVVNVEQKLSDAQEAVRQEAISLGITDGNDPFRLVNQYYVWNAQIPYAKQVKALTKRVEDLEKMMK